MKTKHFIAVLVATVFLIGSMATVHASETPVSEKDIMATGGTNLDKNVLTLVPSDPFADKDEYAYTVIIGPADGNVVAEIESFATATTGFGTEFLIVARISESSIHTAVDEIGGATTRVEILPEASVRLATLT